MDALRRLDIGLLRAARTRGHDRRAEHAVAAFSDLGEHAAVWLALGAAGAAADGARREQWRHAAATVAVAYAANTALKLIVRRRRPRLRGLPPLTRTPTQLSFPSAHATSSFAGASVYSALGVPAGPLYALAGALAASRVYLGVHYPSDVLGGAALGTLIAAARRASPPPRAAAPADLEPPAGAPPAAAVAGDRPPGP